MNNLPWGEEVYRKDVSLWAEFILLNKDILEEHKSSSSNTSTKRANHEHSKPYHTP